MSAPLPPDAQLKKEEHEQGLGKRPGPEDEQKVVAGMGQAPLLGGGGEGLRVVVGGGGEEGLLLGGGEGLATGLTDGGGEETGVVPDVILMSAQF